MDVFEILSLLFLGGTFLIALLTYINNCGNDKRKREELIPLAFAVVAVWTRKRVRPARHSRK